jgi:hypothetical protein
MRMTKAKAITSAIGAVVSVLTLAFADDVFNASEAGTVAAVVVEQALTIFAVYRVPNRPVR